ncbi:MAG TPA: hypothetical protein VGB48_01460 [Allosphingosinicella sp.]|jgi:hypothetical protein
MKLVSTLALSAVLLSAGFATPAAAQATRTPAPAKKEATASERKYNVSNAARKPLAALSAAVTAKNYSNYPALLAAAEAVAKNTDERYLVAKYRLQYAIDNNDKAGQRAGVEAVLASGGADAAETERFKNFLAAQAANSGDPAAGEAFYAQRVAANANDIDAVINLARIKLELKKDAESLDLLQRAISLSKASGKTADESLYRNAVSIAYRLKRDAIAYDLGNEAIRLYPNQENFNNLIALTQTRMAKDEEAFADLLRLMQITGRIESSTEYLHLAQFHEYNRNWGEAKTVLEAAAKAGKTSAAHSALLKSVSSRIAEDRAALASAEPKARTAANGNLAKNLAQVYAGYQDYAKAADLYRVALQKGGVDTNLVNTRLGITLALAGQRAEAEAAFRAVTGPRAPLANLWLAWLSIRG